MTILSVSAPLRRSGNPLQSRNNTDDVTLMLNRRWGQSNAQHWPAFLDLKTQTGGQDPRFYVIAFRKCSVSCFMLFFLQLSRQLILLTFSLLTYNSLFVILLLCTTLALERKLMNSFIFFLGSNNQYQEKWRRQGFTFQYNKTRCSLCVTDS